MLNSFLGIKMRKLLITLSSTLLLFMSGMVSAAQTGTFLSIEEEGPEDEDGRQILTCWFLSINAECDSLERN